MTCFTPRGEPSLLSKGREGARHLTIDLTFERDDEIGESLEPLPAPGVEFRRLAVMRSRDVNFVIRSGETKCKPFLPLAPKFREAMIRRTRIRREFVIEPFGLGEIIGLCDGGLFVQFAQRRIDRPFAPADAALRHS